MSVKEKPHYTLPAATLAQWIESQRDKWWFVDGDPLLTSIVDFPCPGDELAPAIRRIGKNLLLRDTRSDSRAKGEIVEANKLDEISDRNNKRRKRMFLLSWVDSDVDWLLIEDEAMVAT